MAHKLKFVAEHRGIPYETHRDVYALKDRLLEDYPEPKELQSLFVIADSLDKNYYADTQPIEELRGWLDRIAELLDILERPEFSGPGGRGLEVTVTPPDEVRRADGDVQPVEIVVSNLSGKPTTVEVREGHTARITAEPDPAPRPRAKKPKQSQGHAYLTPREQGRKRKRKGSRRRR